MQLCNAVDEAGHAQGDDRHAQEFVVVVRVFAAEAAECLARHACRIDDPLHRISNSTGFVAIVSGGGQACGW